MRSQLICPHSWSLAHSASSPRCPSIFCATGRDGRPLRSRRDKDAIFREKAVKRGQRSTLPRRWRRPSARREPIRGRAPQSYPDLDIASPRSEISASKWGRLCVPPLLFALFLGTFAIGTTEFAV